MKKHKHKKSIPIKCLMGFHKFETTGKLCSIYWVKCERCGLDTTKNYYRNIGE